MARIESLELSGLEGIICANQYIKRLFKKEWLLYPEKRDRIVLIQRDVLSSYLQKTYTT